MFSSSLPKTILRLTVVLALMIFGAWSFYNYQQAQQELEVLRAENEAATAQGERQDLLLAVGRLMPLPDEDPIILDIENAATIAESQPFFADAVDGDKLLIYLQAGRGIIYSPTRNIIVNVGTLTAQNPNQIEATDAAEVEE